MFKKFIAAVMATSICFSNLAYAQYQPVDTLTTEEVALYMTSIDEGGKREKGLPPEAIAIGVGGALLFAYAAKKISKDPTLGRYFVMAQDPKAYAKMMEAAEKKAATASAKSAVSATRAAEVELMKNYERAMRHKPRIEKINRANYWKFVGSATSGNYTAANKYLAQWKKGTALLTKPTTGRFAILCKKGGKVAMAIGLLAIPVHAIFGGDDEENTVINNNRNLLEREINRLRNEDPDSLATFIYSLNDEQRKVAYGILAEDPELYKLIVSQVEESLTEENINAMIEYNNAVEEAELRNDLQVTDKEISDTNNRLSHPREIGGYIWPNM